MRIFKLVRHFAGLQSLIYTLNQAYKELGLLLLLIAVSLLTVRPFGFYMRKNIKGKVKSTFNLDCVHDIFCGEGRVSVDISGQFLVFPDDPHHGGLRAPASVNVRQAGWRFVCSPRNIHPHSPTSHCSKQLLHDIQKQVREEPKQWRFLNILTPGCGGTRWPLRRPRSSSRWQTPGLTVSMINT